LLLRSNLCGEDTNTISDDGSRGLDNCRAWVELPYTALAIRRSKGFERLHEARQGRLHHASPDLPDPRLAMGNADVDPGEDGYFDDLVVSCCLLRQYT